MTDHRAVMHETEGVMIGVVEVRETELATTREVVRTDAVTTESGLVDGQNETERPGGMLTRGSLKILHGTNLSVRENSQQRLHHHHPLLLRLRLLPQCLIQLRKRRRNTGGVWRSK